MKNQKNILQSNIYEPPHDKGNKVDACPAKTQLCTQWVVKDPGFLHVDSEDSDQSGQMPRLIWGFTGRTCHFVGFVMRRLISFFCSIYVELFVWEKSYKTTIMILSFQTDRTRQTV